MARHCAMLATLAAAASATISHPIDPATPKRLAAHADVQSLLAGYVDPTLAPYNAAGDGVADGAPHPTTPHLR